MNALERLKARKLSKRNGGTKKPWTLDQVLFCLNAAEEGIGCPDIAKAIEPMTGHTLFSVRYVTNTWINTITEGKDTENMSIEDLYKLIYAKKGVKIPADILADVERRVQEFADKLDTYNTENGVNEDDEQQVNEDEEMVEA